MSIVDWLAGGARRSPASAVRGGRARIFARRVGRRCVDGVDIMHRGARRDPCPSAGFVATTSTISASFGAAHAGAGSAAAAEASCHRRRITHPRISHAAARAQRVLPRPFAPEHALRWSRLRLEQHTLDHCIRPLAKRRVYQPQAATTPFLATRRFPVAAHLFVVLPRASVPGRRPSRRWARRSFSRRSCTDVSSSTTAASPCGRRSRNRQHRLAQFVAAAVGIQHTHRSRAHGARFLRLTVGQHHNIRIGSTSMHTHGFLGDRAALFAPPAAQHQADEHVLPQHDVLDH